MIFIYLHFFNNGVYLSISLSYIYIYIYTQKISESNNGTGTLELDTVMERYNEDLGLTEPVEKKITESVAKDPT